MAGQCFLNHRIQGEGSPVFVLHGLFGSMDNLSPVARKLAESYQVISVDLRNHGRSFHVADMTYPLMAEDIIKLMGELEIPKAVFVGHSMGGKVAMQVALKYPEKVRALIIGDIAPVSYDHSHDNVLRAIKAYQPEKALSRKDADDQFARFIESYAVRQLLIKGLMRGSQGHFVWRMNAPALVANYDAIRAALEFNGTAFDGPVLFVKGSESDYLLAKHKDEISRCFPQASLKVMTGVGHWLHAEKPDLFNGIIERFLDALD